MKLGLLIACLGLLAPAVTRAESLEITIDDKAARAVLKAVEEPSLTRDQALAIARLPGNEGLIEKAKSYGQSADEGRLADALVAAARHEISDSDAIFEFAKVRDTAPEIEKTLDALTQPSARTVDEVKRRVGMFTPARVHGLAIGYIVVGGTSGGFSFDKPQFYLNLAYFPSPLPAKTILMHELYHAVQNLARTSGSSAAVDACLSKLPAGRHLSELFVSLSDEGTASYVGDVLSLPSDSDQVTHAMRERMRHNIGASNRSITLLELSIHALSTASDVSYDDIYALGFYNDEILYAIGYLMAKAIATERGPGAVAELIDKPASRFVTSYVALPGYGKTKDVPRLDPETIAWAGKLAGCGA